MLIVRTNESGEAATDVASPLQFVCAHITIEPRSRYREGGARLPQATIVSDSRMTRQRLHRSYRCSASRTANSPSQTRVRSRRPSEPCMTRRCRRDPRPCRTGRDEAATDECRPATRSTASTLTAVLSGVGAWGHCRRAFHLHRTGKACRRCEHAVPTRVGVDVARAHLHDRLLFEWASKWIAG